MPTGKPSLILGKSGEIPVIDLSEAPGEHMAWDKPRLYIYAWAVMEMLFVTNPWQISSRLRVKILRMFGAELGNGIVYRPRTRVKFPWKLHIGDRSWIGEGVWIHNQDHVYIGHDVVISQESFVTTGSHSHRTDMGLITKPVIIDNGAWVTTRCIILGGSHIGVSSIIKVGTTVESNTIVDSNTVYGNKIGIQESKRFNYSD